MSTIGNWLASLGMSQYAQAFESNDIDMDLLLQVDDQTLKDIGVASAGHRLRIRNAIAELDARAFVATVDSPRTEAVVAAERRQVTVMFIDLVGSTALSTRLDPEDLRALIGAYHKCVADTVVKFDGFVAKYMGDGVLIYFGYPAAHEDDAERAVRAGLALIDAVARLTTFEPLKVRIGAETGLVVVGDLVGSGEAQERGIVGETPNLAARLQSAASPGALVIGPATRRMLGSLFEYRSLGGIEAKGFAAPVPAYQVVRPIAVESRFEALRATMTPLVGREEEIELLQRRWRQARAGDGSVVLISGEPGIGKSRLTAWLLEQVAGERHTRMRYFCSPQHSDSALYPIIGHFERAAAFRHDDDARAKLDKLDLFLSRTATSSADASLIADLMSLPNDGRYPVLDLTPQQRRQKTLEALIGQVEVLAHRQPVLLIFEDIHWIDATTLELLGRTIDRLRALPVLFVMTFRPEFDPPWIGQDNVTSLVLNRLRQREVMGMIERLIGNKGLPADVLAEIVERTDGVPLFVEEMTNAILEVGEQATREAASAIPSAAHVVPATLHASLMARLDRLGPAKEVAQIGAAIGREFSYEMIAAVSSQSQAELGAALERLKRAGLLFVQGTPPYATYLFKHALIQDAAYGTLLRETRRNLHVRIAAALSETFPQVAETQPEILGYHHAQAGEIEKAAGFWGKAGLRSIGRSALAEGIAHLTKALDQFAILPATPEIRREQMKLQVALAGTLGHVRGFSSADTIAALERANAMIEEADALGEQSEDILLRASVMYGLWVSRHVAADHPAALRRSEQFLAVAEKMREPTLRVLVHRMKGITLTMMGRFAAGRDELDRVLAGYVPERHRLLGAQTGIDMRVSALSYRSWGVWALGYPDAALQDAEDALKHGREFELASMLMYTLHHTAMPAILCGKIRIAEQRVQELGTLAEDKGSSMWLEHARLMQGAILAINRDDLHAIGALTEAIDIRNSNGTDLLRPWADAMLAHAYANSGQYDLAKSLMSHALDAIEKTNERWAEAEIYRLSGEIVRASPHSHPQEAEARFRRSIEIAQRQQAKSWELRGATSLARLLLDESRRKEAHDVLAPVLDWFTEGFATVDLIDAKAVLATIGASDT